MSRILGIDIGCSSVKYGIVDTIHPEKVEGFDQIRVGMENRERCYIDTLIRIIDHLDLYDAVGIGFPSIVWPDRVMDTEIEHHFIWQSVRDHLSVHQMPVFALNDADAAGMAEVMRPAAVEYRQGATIVLTLDIGIGSAIFIDGHLLPNSELGLMSMQSTTAEKYLAPSIKTRDNLSLEEWAERLQIYLAMVERIFNPDHLVLGGGISADFEQFQPYLQTHCSLRAAHFRNQAGVIGAALHANHRMSLIN